MKSDADVHKHGAHHQDHDASREPGHSHEHEDHHGHEHDGRGKFLSWLPFLGGHKHGATAIDRELEDSARGIGALKISLAVLMLTAAFQTAIVLVSGSTALLSDTLHNFSDALTALPLWAAFVMGRRAANARYTYGYGRAEDIAGAFVVGMIAVSAAIAGYESVTNLLDPHEVRRVPWVVVAAITGFLGNEAVALYRMRVGREIGSASLVADGQHAQADGLTSLAVLIGALGSAAGYPIADPLVGLGITLAICYIAWDSGGRIWHRLMDAVEPGVQEQLAAAAGSVEGVEEMRELQVRWIGHQLHADLAIAVDEDLPTHAAHRIAEEVRHALFHANDFLRTINIHVEPCGHGGADAHGETAHHEAPDHAESHSPSPPAHS